MKSALISLLLVSIGSLANAEIYKFDVGLGTYHCVNTTDIDNCNRPLAFEPLEINMQNKDEKTRSGSWEGAFPYNGVNFTARIDVVETTLRGGKYTNIISTTWNSLDTKKTVMAYETKNFKAWKGKTEQVGKYVQQNENNYFPFMIITSKGYNLRNYLEKNHALSSLRK
jgi:hypothetical protein